MDRLATKRLSIWLVLISWGFAAATGTPGFHLMVTGAINLIILMMLRTVSHFEGEYMARTTLRPTGKIVVELIVIGAVGGCCLTVLIMLVRHVPWLWFPTGGN